MQSIVAKQKLSIQILYYQYKYFHFLWLGQHNHFIFQIIGTWAVTAQLKQ